MYLKYPKILLPNHNHLLFTFLELIKKSKLIQATYLFGVRDPFMLLTR